MKFEDYFVYRKVKSTDIIVLVNVGYITWSGVLS